MSNREVVELLRPILASGYAGMIEALLPEALRPNWRRVALFVVPGMGRKPLDHRGLLLAMAKCDENGTARCRTLAEKVVKPFRAPPDQRDPDDREYVVLPGGMRSGRRDLVDRLARAYEIERDDLRAQVARTEEAAAAAGARAARLRQRNRPFVRKGPAKVDPAYAARLHDKLRLGSLPPVTAYQVDCVRDAVRKRGRRSSD